MSTIVQESSPRHRARPSGAVDLAEFLRVVAALRELPEVEAGPEFVQRLRAGLVEEALHPGKHAGRASDQRP